MLTKKKKASDVFRLSNDTYQSLATSKLGPCTLLKAIFFSNSRDDEEFMLEMMSVAFKNIMNFNTSCPCTVTWSMATPLKN